MFYLLLLVSSQFVCNPIATQPTSASLVEVNVTIDSFTTAEEAVRTYSGNHPEVMAGCQQYLDEIRALQADGKIKEEDTSRILDAVAFSAEKHQYQKRKNPEQ